jgi:hypothetical protein
MEEKMQLGNKSHPANEWFTLSFELPVLPISLSPHSFLLHFLFLS